MLTVLLRFNNRAVAAAVVRVFGPQLAELPLVATRPDARRLGHARVLVKAIEAMLVELGVQVRGVGGCQAQRLVACEHCEHHDTLRASGL
jgi:GNAT superfamily N-acetyltransferase